MKNKKRLNSLARIMVALGGLGALLVVALRVWIIPAQRDMDTGLFTSNLLVIGLTLALLAALGAVVYLMRDTSRREIVGNPALVLSTVLLIVGGVMFLHGVVEMLARFGVVTFYSVTTMWVEEGISLPQVILPWVQTVLSIFSGVAFVLFGLNLASEGGTRRGISKLGLLVPVLWMWFVLANYMITYVSMVRITEGFFTVATYIMELLFLFRFAGYMAGVGKHTVGSTLFVSCGTALFALSAPLVRLLLHLLQDTEAASAAGATGPLDLAIGVLALTVSITLCQSLSALPASEVEEDSVEWSDPEDTSSDVELIGEEDAADFIEE